MKSIQLCLLVLLATVVATCAAPAMAGRPNIILIMSDDMGYSDIGCYGSEIETPNLDGLADDGVRFTQFYNGARCCSTRASLLTGLYPHQAGIGWMMSDNGVDAYRGNLSGQSVTIAEALKPAGYSTYMAGKWHVTRHIKPEGPNYNWPLQRGFDRFYGTIHGAGSFFDPNTLMRDNTMISPYADPDYKPAEYYYTDAISDHAVRFVDEHNEKQPDKPFFMYVSYTAAHWPMQALQKDIDKYKGRYDEGYDAIREARFEKMKKIGLLPADSKLPAAAKDWSEVDEPNWELRNMEVYGAMVDCMDRGIGRIVESLKKSGDYDNTLILFLQDNGGCAEGMGRNSRSKTKQKRANKPSLPVMAADALQPDMIPKQTRDGWPMLQGRGVLPGPNDTYIGYGEGWANVSNTPFREYKHWVHEGGISTPLIAHWPERIKRKGQLDSTPSHLIDIMATCVDVAQATYPQTRQFTGETSTSLQTIQAMEGMSLMPAIDGQTTSDRPLFWEHEGNKAVRLGNMKLVAKRDRQWELYDISKDRIEQNNLVDAEPKTMRKLAALWVGWAERVKALPLTPYYKQRKAKTKPTAKEKAAGKGTNKGTTKTKFERKTYKLVHGDQLPQAKAPKVANQELSISTIVTLNTAAGVVVAQGGTAHGYSLFFENGQSVFAVNRSGKVSRVTHPQVLAAGTHVIKANINKDGKATLTVNKAEAATAQLDGPCATTPIDGLSIGSDSGASVTNYLSGNQLQGKVNSLTLTVGGEE